TATGREYRANSVVLTTGTFLRGRIISGELTSPAGRAGEAPSNELSSVLGELSFPLIRLKTGTPPRIDARTIDFSKTVLQPGSPTPLYFSHERIRAIEQEPLPTYPQPDDGRWTMDDEGAYRPSSIVHRPSFWRSQMACYLVQ